MSDIDGDLKMIQVGKQDNGWGTTWGRLTDQDIVEIKAVFAKHVMPKVDGIVTEADKMRQSFYDTYRSKLEAYAGSAAQTNEFDAVVYEELLRIARVAAGLEFE